MFLVTLVWGHPARGGLDVGLGVEIAPGEVYGAALERAYQLESEVAQHPRLVIGKELVAYLDFLTSRAAACIPPLQSFSLLSCL